MALFRYERLLDICFVYGRLDHQENECDEAMKARKIYGEVRKEYGAWMRADGRQPKISSSGSQGKIGMNSFHHRLFGGGRIASEKDDSIEES